MLVLLSGMPTLSADAQEKTKKNAKDGADMVFIPAGEFTMGDKEFTNAKPHTVVLDGYYIYRTPVTVAQYLKFCDETGHARPKAPDFNPNWSKRDHPIVDVSYDDALAYCKWAKVKLPTEAQWEKAARGTDSRLYPWGNAADSDGLSASRPKTYATGTTPVGSFPLEASPFGVLDTAGNGYQWCSDWSDENFYSHRLATERNPENQSVGEKKLRVVRGSSWFLYWDTFAFRTAHRIFVPDGRYDHTGFRCVSGL
jgi:formylglycine-generating enzyme required for sulfatase activity